MRNYRIEPMGFVKLLYVKGARREPMLRALGLQQRFRTAKTQRRHWNAIWTDAVKCADLGRRSN